MDKVIVFAELLGVAGTLISFIGGIVVLGSQAIRREKTHAISEAREEIKVTIEVGKSRRVVRRRSTGDVQKDIEAIAHELPDLVS